MSRQWLWMVLVMCASVWLLACDDDEDEDENGDDPTADFETLDAGVCALDAGPFALEIDNTYFPLPVGRVLVLEGEDEGETIRVEITVLDETEDVGGVTTRVVEESEFEDDELVEVSRNFFAQAGDGTVCYFGEDVNDYEDGEIVGHEGEWRAGEGGNEPGIIMPGDPKVETKFNQEFAPGIAEDMSAILEVGISFDVTADSFDDVLHAIDWDPLDGETGADGEDKYFAAGVGPIVDDVIELISITD